ncbi:unnamed protein product [Microthlaspi erraticum]|uniref:Fucosyltransferase n=1 Tax=Microthlaspi erraticum TaxID=1685480 RepID=A0A6D2I3L6_9BRAS|nr:unnamed protein product [Microthlaspi erraticum]
MGHKEHGGTWHMEAAQLGTQGKKGEAILKTSSTVYSTNRSSSSTRPAKLQLDRAGKSKSWIICFIFALAYFNNSAYLAKADQRIGIRIEVSDTGNDQFQHLVEQILACGVRHELLPEVDKQRHHLPSSKVLNRKTKAVFVSSSSSSSSGYFESIRDVYWENPAVRGEIISVYIYV